VTPSTIICCITRQRLAPSVQRAAHGNFSLACGAASKHQICRIRDGNQPQHTRRSEQGKHRSLYVVVHQYIQIGFNPDYTMGFAQLGIGVIGRDALLEKGHLRAGVRNGRTSPQACHDRVSHCL
jgi:hypothetical protein